MQNEDTTVQDGHADMKKNIIARHCDSKLSTKKLACEIVSEKQLKELPVDLCGP